MDSQFEGSHDSVNGHQSPYATMSPGSEEILNYANFFNYKDPSVDLSSIKFPNLQPPDVLPANIPSYSFSGENAEEAGSPEENDPDAVLKYIRQVLMEEDIDDKPCMLRDCLALQAAEKPFYDVLGKNYTLSPDQHPLSDQYVHSPDDNSPGSVSSCGYNASTTNTNTTTTVSVDSISNSSNKGFSIQNHMADPHLKPSAGSPWSYGSSAGTNGADGSGPSVSADFNIFSDRESMIQFQKGVEEANKFLPKPSNLVIDLENITYPKEPKETPSVVKSENEGNMPGGSRVRRIHYRDDKDLEGGRSSKQSAISVEEEADDLSEMFDKVLLPPRKNENSCSISSPFQKQEHPNAMTCLLPLELDQSRLKKEDGSKNVVDLRSLLILGAQAVASDDQRSAAELLKQIRQHSSPLGDGSQRLAHFFANALEARMFGTGSQIFTALASKQTTAAQMLKAYHLLVSFCPFKKISMMFSTHSILKISEKRKKLHVIDFGILYGFQWPALIQHLSEQPEGPPMLRITGIELPQPGFKPAERVEDTGRRLAKYCERFNVPFEFHAVAQKWETIKLEDIKLEKDEIVVVNCLFRFKYLLDETIVADSPRDAVLRLIRKIKPDLFVHGVYHGSFNAPFFITRFREALFYYSTLFDMHDTIIPRENPERSMLEREFYGQEIMNIVACEGTERVERPETYKQWQVRIMRAGFRQLPLHPQIMEKAKYKMKYYHKDYSLDVDGSWALTGWKGRVTCAVSTWIPC